MKAEADRQFPLETGGILLGWRDVDVIVEDIIGPGPNAAHRRTAFEPDSRWQDEQLADRYEASGRTLEYLGDWHTHPVGVPEPSSRDRQTLSVIASFAPARCKQPIMTILGDGAAGVWTHASHALVARRPRLRRTTRSLETRLIGEGE
jgi:integrative and conjugative element protein (TIGR02256 family)